MMGTSKNSVGFLEVPWEKFLFASGFNADSVRVLEGID